MYYRLGQAFPRPFAAYAYPRKKRLDYLRTKPSLEENIEHFVNVTQSIKTTFNETVIQYVNVTQNIDVLGLEINSGVTSDVLSQQIIIETVNNTLPLDQSV